MTKKHRKGRAWCPRGTNHEQARERALEAPPSRAVTGRRWHAHAIAKRHRQEMNSLIYGRTWNPGQIRFPR